MTILKKATGPRPLRSIYRTLPEMPGGPVHYLEAGHEHEHTLVLLHGLMSSTQTWRHVIEPLARRYRVIVPDLPAHGRDRSFVSDALAPTIPSLVDWLEHLLESIAAQGQVHLVAHSLGGTLAYELAADRGRVPVLDGLVLISPGFRLPIPRWSSSLISRFPRRVVGMGTSRLGLRAFEPFHWRVSRMDRRELESYLRPLREPERLDFMIHILADLARRSSEPPAHLQGDALLPPTLMLWGRQDPLLPWRWGERYAERLGALGFEVFDRCGHCPQEDQPEAFIAQIDAFLLGDDPS